ncbi:MAG: YbjP/YqhG family protein [Anaerolineae bacterium]|nr:YbjP/YqhG family protein [Anaerolineae bacterium]
MKARLIVFAVCAALTLVPVSAQEPTGAADPVEAVEGFYRWYLDAAQRINPVVEGAYRESAFLSADMIEAVDSLIAEAGPDHGLGYDPFLCAQDVPERFEIGQVDALTDRDAAVLVHGYFSHNPHPNAFVVSVHEQDGAWLIANVICQETLTPRGVTQAFYNWYLEQTPGSEALDARYPFLTDGLNARIQEARSARELGDGDPVLCAQDFPNHIGVTAVSVGQESATMFVRAYYSGNPQPRTLTVKLVRDQQWMIDDIVCGVAPETVAEYLYNEYITYTRYDMERGIDRTPITDWAFAWGDYLSEDLLADLEATFASEAPRAADPVLCAQDIPTRVTAEAVSASEQAATVQITGEYASGPETFTAHALASLEMALEGAQWKVTAITCGE